MLVTLDWECAYGTSPSGRKVTIRAQTTEEYVRDPEFLAHGVGIKVNDGPPRYYYGNQIEQVLRLLPWDEIYLLCHHTQFDGAILAWRYGIYPKFYLDTISMAQAIYNHVPANLAYLSEFLGLGTKGKELATVKDKWFLTEEEQKVMEGYCATNPDSDVNLTYRIFQELKKGFPVSEFETINDTIWMFTNPVFEINTTPLIPAYAQEVQRKADLVAATGRVKTEFTSNQKFALLLESRGVKVPMKINDKGEAAFAFAKTDEEFLALEFHPDPVVKAYVAARLGTKTSIVETRIKRFIEIGGRGRLPCYLKANSAKTFRWGGGDKSNLQNLSNRGTGLVIRESMEAPEGHAVVVGDSSQIECLYEDTKVLTYERGYVKIQHILKSDSLWDGIEWVTHEGVVCTGTKEIMTYDGITATPDHSVYTSDGRRIHLAVAEAEGAVLAAGEREGKPVWYVGGDGQANTIAREEGYAVVPLCVREEPGCSMWQGTACERKRPSEREVAELRNSPSAESSLPRDTEGSCRNAANTLQQNSSSDEPTEQEPCVRGISSEGDKEPLHVNRGVRHIYVGDSPTPRLHRAGDRQDRQRRPLRAGESTAGDKGGECPEPQLQYNGRVAGSENECQKVCAGLLPEVPLLLSDGDDKERVCPRQDNPPPDSEAARRDIMERRKGKVYDIINSGPRNRFTAEGKIVSNCRLLNTLAGQDDRIEMFRSGGDPYNDMATDLYGEPIDRKLKILTHIRGDIEVTNHKPHQIDELLKQFGGSVLQPFKKQGNIGKAVTLGCGYSMGWLNFQGQLRVGFLGMEGVVYGQEYVEQLQVDVDRFRVSRSYDHKFRTLEDQALANVPLGMDPMEHLVHCAVVWTIVSRYREKNPKVKAYWKLMNNALGYMMNGQEVQLGPVQTVQDGLLMPNGLVMGYSGLRMSKSGEYSYLKQIRGSGYQEWVKTYGGSVVENICQSLSRILISDSITDTRKAGYNVALTVHDEQVSVVPTVQAQACGDFVYKRLCTPPVWMPNLPLDASIDIVQNYAEAK